MHLWTQYNLFDPPASPRFPAEPSSLPPLPAAASSAAERVRWISRCLLETLLDRLPDRTLVPGLREKLRGWLGGCDMPVAAMLVRGYHQRPELFPDLRPALEALDADTAEAKAWGQMQALLRDMLARCEDGLAWAEGRSTRRASDILDYVIAGADHPGLAPHLDHEQRLLALNDALLLRQQLRDHLIQRRSQRQAERESLAGLTEEERRQHQAESRQHRQERRQRRNRRAEAAANGLQLSAALLCKVAAEHPPTEEATITPRPPGAAPAGPLG